MASEELLRMDHVVKSYTAPDGSALPVLADINLVTSRAEAVVITGPSGSGKSTLLNIAGALDRPTSGKVHLSGSDLGGLNDRELAGIRNRGIGFVFQLHHLLPQCTALENVLIPTLAGAADADRDCAAGRAEELLARVGLSGRMDFRPASLSGGERQRVAVVRALINRPGLLLADEPTGSLDRKASDDLVDLLVELKDEQEIGLVVVTHSESVAARMDRRLLLRDGMLCPE